LLVSHSINLSPSEQLKYIFGSIAIIFLLVLLSALLFGDGIKTYIEMFSSDDLARVMNSGVNVVCAGVMMSMIMWNLVALKSLAPVIFSQTIIFAIAAISGGAAALKTKECDNPFTVTYASGTNQRPRHQVCVIRGLERGLLLYDQKARATIFIPWSQVNELIRRSSSVSMNVLRP
jgi:hypothetical protein